MPNLSVKQSEAWHLLEKNNGASKVLYGGAAGGGKTYLACVWQINRRLTYPESVGFIARNVLKTIKESTFITFIRVAADMGYILGDHYSYNDTYGIIQFKNGSRIYLKELKYKPSDPEFTDLGSTEFTDGVFEECTEITEKAFDILCSRVRYVKNEKHGWTLTPKVLLTCNPSLSWVKNRFITNDNNEPVMLKHDERVVIATLDDNPDADFVKTYEGQLQGLSGYDYARLRYGDWNVKAEPHNAFATAFDPERHVSLVPKYDPLKPVYVSMDFNIDPFAFGFYHFWQDALGMHLHCFDECTIPNGTIQKGIDHIQTYYAKSIPMMKFTGDPGGNKREFSQKDHSSVFIQLTKALRLRTGQLITPSAPKHTNSRADCNYFLYHFDDFQVNRDKCPGLVFDLKYVEVDNEGGIIKANRKDPTQRADHLDQWRYLINTFLKTWIIRHQSRK